jgi:YVTN family beta-propeller protein
MGKLASKRAGLLILVAIAAATVHLMMARAAEPKKAAPPKYLSPIAMIADKAGKTIYIAQKTAGSVALFDVASRKITATIDIEPQVSGVTISPNGTTLYVTSGGADGKLCVIDVKTRKVTNRIRAGHTPMSPLVSPDGKIVYVCNRFNNAIGVVNLAAGKQIATIPVPRQPVSADLSKDGKTLFVANHLSTAASDQDYVAAEVTILDTTGKNDAIHVKLPNGSVALRRLKISPDGKLAAVTFTMARFHLPTTQLERGWMNTSAVSLIDVARKKLINTILLDDVDHGAANPWAIAWSADSKTLCASHAGTREISVIEMPKLLTKLAQAVIDKKEHEVQNHLAFLVGVRCRLKLAGAGPRSMAIIGDKAYVGEYFTDSLSVVDISAEAKPKTGPDGKPEKTKVETIALGPKIEMTTARRGEMLFNDADKMCFQMWQSCATCHPDGRADGLHWDTMCSGMGNPRNTRSMLLSHKTPPVMSTGIRPNAKIAVLASIRFLLFAIRPHEDALAILEYIKSIEPEPSPMLINGKLSPAALRGQKLFKTAKCASCHSGELFTDKKKHLTGTAVGVEAEKLMEFDTPTLVEVWRTAPYLSRGQAATVLDVLSKKNNPNNQHGKTSDLTKKQLADLAEYVMSL